MRALRRPYTEHFKQNAWWCLTTKTQQFLSHTHDQILLLKLDQLQGLMKVHDVVITKTKYTPAFRLDSEAVITDLGNSLTKVT